LRKSRKLLALGARFQGGDTLGRRQGVSGARGARGKSKSLMTIRTNA
jgi:hypothetical protein